MTPGDGDNPPNTGGSENPEEDRPAEPAQPDQQALPPQPGWPPAQGWPPPQQGWAPPPPRWQPPQSWPPAQSDSPWSPPQQPRTWTPVQPSPGWTPPPPGWQPSPPIAARQSRMPVVLAIVACLVIAFGAGMVADRAVAAPAPSAQQSPPLQGFDVYEQALKDIRTNYVGRKDLTDQQLLYGSIAGMVNALGDTNHSRFLTPAEYKQLQSELSGTVAGIGVLIDQANGAFVVQKVIAASPAEKAGIEPGDQIVAVDGKQVAGLTFEELASLIRGAIGTKVTVTVIHPGSTASTSLTMTRAQISMPLVEAGLVPGTHIFDITLFEFSDGAANQVKAALAEAKSAGATSLILDLRGNPGGIADEAQAVASQFLSKGNVYLVEDANGNKTSIPVDTSWKATTLPLVVLVDGNTASAAEIVAGAIQDAGRGKIVGVNTIGTGTVLEPFPLSDGSVLLLGVRDWLTPDGHRIFGVGIKPDKVVSLPVGGQPLDPSSFPKMSLATIQASGDAQLIEAIKELGG